MKKIAHLQLLPMMSGVQQVSFQELTRLPADQYEGAVVCRENGALPKALAEEGIGAHFVNDLQRSIHPVRDFKALLALRKLFKAQRFDVVHTHSSKTGFLGRVAARLAGVRCIVHTVHGFAFPAANSKIEYFIYWVLEWIAGRCCHAVVVLTESDRQICIKSLGLSENKVHVIPNGIDTQKYCPLSDNERLALRREKFDVRDDTVIALMVGRLWRQKAPEVLAEAAIKVFEQQSDSPLLVHFVGDGELREQLEDRVRNAGFENRIRFMGWRSDVPQLLQAADLFILPSRWEGLSLAILEAMACKVAVIASDIPGNKAALYDGECGVLAPLEDSEALADEICIMAQSRERRETIGDAGYQRVMKHHVLGRRIETLEKLYEQILEEV